MIKQVPKLHTSSWTSAGSLLSAQELLDSSRSLHALGELDVMVRITGAPEGAELGFAAIETRNFYHGVESTYLSYLHKFENDVNTLKKVVKWQHSQLDYNSYYNAFLLEQLSESEFEEIAARFAYENTDVSADELAESVRNVLSLTEIEYPPAELAEFFRCDYSTIIESYRSLALEMPSLAHMVPAKNALSREES